MFLGQHHFQQWDRYYQGLLGSQLKSVTPLYWGLIDLEINQESLENGTFMLLSCRGILPGGIYIDIPGVDDAPASRAIEDHFDPSLEILDVYLTIPADRPGSANCRLEDGDGSGEARYFRDFAQGVDENTGGNEQEIPIARKALKILFAGESLDGHDYLKIGELQRTPGGFVLRDDYIPSCITISASQPLVRIVRRLTELLTAKSDELREQCRERGDGFYEFGAGDVSNLWFLQTINSFIPELNHFYRTGRGHPEDLFRLLSRFAGALTVFSVNIRPINLPEYRHEELSYSFEEIDRRIQELLQILGPTTRYVLIPLEKVQESIYRASMSADLLSSGAYKFYMAARGEGDQGDLIREIQRRAKVASDNDMNMLIGRALRGIALNHLLSPPEAIVTKSGYCYFVLDPKSDFWGGVHESKVLDVYIPVSLGKIELELMALQEE